MFEEQIAKLAIWGQKNAPQLLFTGGIMSGVASTVLACRATLKASDVLAEAEKGKAEIEQADFTATNNEAVTYTKSDKNRDTLLLYVQTAAKFGKLYGPAVLLGVASVVMLTKSQSILNQRNAGLAAALTATTTAFSDYRQRVAEEYGPEKELELRHGKVMVDVPVIDKNGKDTGKTKQVAKHSGRVSMYGKAFGPHNDNWSKHPETNMYFLKCAQNWMNDQLNGRGHVFLNEVYDQLGFDRTPAGSQVGWIRGEGDEHINFGVFRDDAQEEVYNFMVGLDDTIMLDFNVQGPIWDRI